MQAVPDVVNYGEFYAGRLLDAITRATDALAHGSVESFPDYRYAVGRIHGIEFALAEFREVQARERHAEFGEDEDTEL